MSSILVCFFLFPLTSLCVSFFSLPPPCVFPSFFLPFFSLSSPLCVSFFSLRCVFFLFPPLPVCVFSPSPPCVFFPPSFSPCVCLFTPSPCVFSLPPLVCFPFFVCFSLSPCVCFSLFPCVWFFPSRVSGASWVSGSRRWIWWRSFCDLLCDISDSVFADMRERSCLASL